MKLENVTAAPRTRPKRWYDDACGTALALEFVGERWSLLIIREMLLGPRRFSDIRAGLPGLSANVLTQRLYGLEDAGIVLREKLPPPASVQVYGLTQWGYKAEPIVMALGQWALQSPEHDPSRPFSRVSLMLALRMMLHRDRVGDFDGAIGFVLGDETFLATIRDGALTIARGAIALADAVMTGTTHAFLPALFGTVPLGDVVARGALTVSGGHALAAQFCTFFELPPKLS